MLKPVNVMSNATVSKRDLIMSTAKSLFIEKGFRGTTISMIAEKAGIAKGSVYSYFSSKLEIVKALLLQVDENAQGLVEQLLTSNDKVKSELVAAYLEQEFQEILNERSFTQVFLTDEIVALDMDVMTVLQESRINYHVSQQRMLLQAYGNDIEPWLYDLVSILNGLLNEYAVYLTLDEAEFSIERCARLVAYLVDNAISSLATSNLEPLFTKNNFPLTKDVNSEQKRIAKAHQLLESMKYETNDMAPEQSKLVMETLGLIESELKAEELNLTLLRALIANLRPYPELHNQRRKLADSLDVELI